MPSDITVLTFGSAVLGSPDEVATAVHEIYRWYRHGLRVLVVAGDIDAAPGAPPRLDAPCGIPDPDAFMPVLLGERGATTILAAALDRAGIPVRMADSVAVTDDVRMAALGGMDESAAPANIRARALDYQMEIRFSGGTYMPSPSLTPKAV
jgi:hypothetical protein